MSTPETMDTHTGSATATHGANTNLDANTQGGPQTGADRAATHDIEQQHTPDDPDE
ncbi:hypothetical protein [Deinococcus sp.]|uniref:hypothetical protein n=1 Tax=Deinococcus sp. TaxID=47478 RepID=UPI002869BA5B|nr:hypothetical protein [Deinococcus sp.]